MRISERFSSTGQPDKVLEEKGKTRCPRSMKRPALVSRPSYLTNSTRFWLNCGPPFWQRSIRTEHPSAHRSAFTRDGKAFYISTFKETVKYKNIKRDPRISITVEEDEHFYPNLKTSRSVTAKGRADLL